MRNVVGIAIFVASAGACFAWPGSAGGKFSSDPDAAVSGAAGHPGRCAAGSGATAGTGTGASERAAPAWAPFPDECHSHDVDIPSATVAGAVTINGAAAGADPNARLLLRNGLNDLVEIPFTGGAYSVRAAPGSYEVFFSATGATAMAPVNQFARLRDGVVILPGGTTTLDVDVPRDDRGGHHHDQRRGPGRR